MSSAEVCCNPGASGGTFGGTPAEIGGTSPTRSRSASASRTRRSASSVISRARATLRLVASSMRSPGFGRRDAPSSTAPNHKPTTATKRACRRCVASRPPGTRPPTEGCPRAPCASAGPVRGSHRIKRFRPWPNTNGDSGDTGTPPANPRECSLFLSPPQWELSPLACRSGDNSFQQGVRASSRFSGYGKRLARLATLSAPRHTGETPRPTSLWTAKCRS